MIRELRAELYRYHWRMRSRASTFGLIDAIEFLEESQHWPRPRLEELRDAKLRRIVAHAHKEIPYYRRLMDDKGIQPHDITGVRDLHKLPILTKDLLREHKDQLRALDFNTKDLEFGVTGGTTGNPMRVARDRSGSVWQRAAYWRGFSWGGLRMGEPWVQVFGGAMGLTQRTPRERAKNWFSGKLFLPAFELSSQNVSTYVEAIRESGARFLIGYASSCYLLARYLERQGGTLALEAVFPTAELLPDTWSDTIARVFGAKVLPYYGCGEVQSIAYSCPEATRQLYHTSDEHVVIEVEQRDGETSLAGEGAFLLTDLDNMAMPLIRYRNGDAGVIAPSGCACGRTLGCITRLDGRVNDVLITTTKNAISGSIGAHAFRLIGHVEHFQVIQRRPGQITIRIVRMPGYDARIEEPKMRAIFLHHLGADADIEIEYVSSIPRTEAGKARVVINEYLGTRPPAASI